MLDCEILTEQECGVVMCNCHVDRWRWLILWVFGLVVSLCSISLAVEVTSVGGVLVNGGSLVIHGKEFGVKATVTPIKFETFEWGNVGDEIDSGNDPISPKWQKAGAGGSIIDNAKSHSGTRSAFKDLKPNSNVCAFYDSYINFPDTEQLYVSYWFYWDTVDGKPLSEGGAFFKLNRINGSNEPYGGMPSLGINLTPHYAIPETGYMDIWGYTDDQSGGKYHNAMIIPSEFTAVHGKWHRVEMWLKLSDPAGSTNGMIEYAIDSIPMEFTGRPGDGLPWEGITLSEGSKAKINVFTLLFGGCRFTDTSYPLLWQDDVYVDNTRARVEIGDAPIWSECSHREIQKLTSWENEEIQITINIGSLDSLSDKYIYVVDSDGNISNGFPLQNAEKSRPANVRDFKLLSRW